MSEMQTSSSRGSTGSMTSLMRTGALAPAPKVLRLGLVHRGKVIDERVLRGEEPFTIGPTEGATFVVVAPGLPSGFRLFERVGDHYNLRLTPRMGARIADGAPTGSVAEIRAETSSAVGERVIVLGADARGKVIVGEHTILFQMVAPAPSVGKAQLPSSVKWNATEVDWRTSVIAAFSFLLHFGAAGSIFSDWTDPVVDEDVSTAQILESVKQLPAPPVVEHPQEASTNPTTSATGAVRDVTPTRGASAGPGRGQPGGGPTGRRSMGEGEVRALSDQLGKLDIGMLAALNGSGSSTSVVLDGGDVPLTMLEKAAGSPFGTSTSNLHGLDLGRQVGAPIGPGQIARGPIPGDPSPITPVSAGSAAAVRPPVGGSAGVGGTTVTGGDVPGAATTVAGLTPGFRRCFVTGLNKEDPNMRGSVRITAKIGPNGEVLSASASGSGSVTPGVVACMRSRVAGAQFSAPTGGSGAVLVIPVTVIPQP